MGSMSLTKFNALAASAPRASPAPPIQQAAKMEAAAKPEAQRDKIG
jgi:hypothetical protein